MKRALVCGAGGFIGSHLVRKLKQEGYWVRGVDLRSPEFGLTQADEFMIGDLRAENNCRSAMLHSPLDEVYQLAADMGGMGYINQSDCEILLNSTRINLNMAQSFVDSPIPRYLFSSSVCVYPDMREWEESHSESFAVPARPDNEYGWEKLYAERVIEACGRRYKRAIRIARFENCYGPESTWRGGREKAPAALCRKVAEAADGGEIEVWGDGTAIRVFTYIDDMIEGIYALMQSKLEGPVNLGSSDRVTVGELAKAIVEASGKRLSIKYVHGPVGVQARNFSKARIESLGWRPKVSLREGIERTYRWVEEQVRAAQSGTPPLTPRVLDTPPSAQ